MSVSKDILRIYFKEKRRLVEDKKLKSHLIFHNLENLDVWKNAKIINTYISLEDEVDTKFIIYHALVNGKRVFSPIIFKDELKFGEIYSFNDLEYGPLGILQPKEVSEIDYDLFDLIIVPGIAFDQRGYRIGYGKGYYDKFLEKVKRGVKIGVIFDELLMDSFPFEIEKHDQKVEIIITDKRVLKIT
ncbi:MAG: 5-formyltetrahydrofolate cyclo-ligase [candidate division WOR-3 bacterium]